MLESFLYTDTLIAYIVHTVNINIRTHLSNKTEGEIFTLAEFKDILNFRWNGHTYFHNKFTGMYVVGM